MNYHFLQLNYKIYFYNFIPFLKTISHSSCKLITLKKILFIFYKGFKLKILYIRKIFKDLFLKLKF
jgi:hypothetical protein